MKKISLMGALAVLVACTSSPQDVASSELSSSKRVIIQFRDGANRKGLVEGVGASIALDLAPQNAAAAHLSARAIDALSKNPAVEYIEEDAPRHPLAQTVPYGIDMVQAPAIWPAGLVSNRKICIIDSGLYTAHEDHQGSATITGYPSGWNTDLCGHGTHVAGTIAAINNNLGVVGVLPYGINLHIVKVFGDDCAWSYSSTLVDALNRCQSAGANVVSMSLGGSMKVKTEETAFANAFSAGVLSIAAAGNDGNNRMSYPASYSSVMSVAAVDSTMTVASFSQFNSAVEIAAPGVGVLSTLPFKDDNSLTVGGVTYAGGWIEFAARSAGVTGTLVNGGLCDSVGAWSGKVVLCERGVISFLDKVNNVKNGGGIAAAIYNNAPGGFAGTLGAGNSSSIPAISLSQEDGQAIIAAGGIGQSATEVSVFTQPASGYGAWDGTSMATPHVSAVAALVWSYNPAWTNQQIRDALTLSALDLGTAGRDNYYGFGLVQAQAALAYAQSH